MTHSTTQSTVLPATTVGLDSDLSLLPDVAFQAGELAFSKSTGLTYQLRRDLSSGGFPTRSGIGQWVLFTGGRAGVAFIYRPGGPASGSIFSDPWQLAFAVLGASVPVDVYVDCSLQTPAPWPVDIFLPNARIHQSPITSAPAVLRLDKGTNPADGLPTDGKLWFISELDAVAVILGSSTPDAMVTVGEIFGQRFIMRDGANVQRPNDLAPPALFIDGQPTFELEIENCLTPFPNPADPTASNVQFLGTLLTVLVTDCGPELSLSPFTGGAASTLSIRYDASVSRVQVSPQPFWAGPLLPVNIDNAGSVSYAASTPGDWAVSPPIKVSAAINRLADAVAALLGHPIP